MIDLNNNVNNDDKNDVDEEGFNFFLFHFCFRPNFKNK